MASIWFDKDTGKQYTNKEAKKLPKEQRSALVDEATWKSANKEADAQKDGANFIVDTAIKEETPAKSNIKKNISTAAEKTNTAKKTYDTEQTKEGATADTVKNTVASIWNSSPQAPSQPEEEKEQEGNEEPPESPDKPKEPDQPKDISTESYENTLEAFSKLRYQDGSPLVQKNEDGTFSLREPISYKEWKKQNGATKRGIIANLLNVAQVAGAFLGIPPIANGDKIVATVTGEDDKAAYAKYSEMVRNANDKVSEANAEGLGKNLNAAYERGITKDTANDTDYRNANRDLEQDEKDLNEYYERRNMTFQQGLAKDTAAFSTKLQAYLAKHNQSLSKDTADFLDKLSAAHDVRHAKAIYDEYANKPGVASQIGGIMKNLSPDSHYGTTFKGFMEGLGDITGAAAPIAGALASDKNMKVFVLPRIWR